MPETTVSLPASPTLEAGAEYSSSSTSTSSPLLKLLGFVPMELENGCTEQGCSVDSDNVNLTNIIRRHYLEHFGHRDLDGIVSDYAEHAFMVHVVNGERKKYHGTVEIRRAFSDLFALHPTTDSSFHLKHVIVHGKHYGMAVWSATTPTAIYPQSSDTFVFNEQGKIVKQFFACQVNPLDTPWYVEDGKKDSE
jgi:ketosteroid isomerase-like protein